MPMLVTVHVALSGEGTEVWRPVQAEHLGGDRYRLIERPADGEMWHFTVGDIVKCKECTLQGDWARDERSMVAYEKSRWD